MSVKDGRIVLPDGMSYRLLVLQNCTSTSPEICRQVSSYQKLPISPIPSTEMSLEVITKLGQLIRNGATVVGPPPESSGEVNNYAEKDTKVLKMASEIWGDLDGKLRTERKFGKGRVIWGKTPREVLLADGVKPDFTFTGQEENPEQFDYIHRTSGDAEIYFVINRTNKNEMGKFTFRISGKQPEIWNPVTGEMLKANAFTQSNGCTTLPLEFNQFGSWFIVFRKPIAIDAVGKATSNFPKVSPIVELGDSWKVTFDPEWGGPGEVGFPTLSNWIENSQGGIKYYSGTATYRKLFNLNEVNEGVKNENGSVRRLYLDLGNVQDVAEVRLNGKKLGILWCAPWRVEITGIVKSSGNQLEIDVINLWANRVIGDLNLPKEKRFTKTHDGFRFDMIRGSTPLLDSGLLGPVRIMKE
jgi:hypothetical protein